jgi:hypothetical protein
MQRKPISKATAWAALAGTLGAIVVANVLRSGDERTAETAVAPATTRETADRIALSAWGSGLPRTGQWRNGFDVVDFDGDGELDIVHGPARKSRDRRPQIWSGDGEGHFTAQTRFKFPSLPLDYGDVAVADFDGDDALDIAVASHLLGLHVLVRRGEEFIAYGEELPALSNFSSRAIEAFDWNADGRMDLIASSDGPRPFEALPDSPRSRRGVVVLLGIEGGFEPLFPASEESGYGDSLAIGELDRTPGLEILAASNVVGSTNLLYRNTETGLTLGPLPGAPEQRVVRVVALAQGRTGNSILLGGLAKGARGLEGSLDVVDANATSTRLFRGEPLRAVTGVGTGDIDADGELDLMIGEEDGRLRRYEADGGGFSARDVIEPDSQLAGCSVYGIAFANLDRHVGDEVVVSYAGDDGACPSSGGLVVYRLTKL